MTQIHLDWASRGSLVGSESLSFASANSSPLPSRLLVFVFARFPFFRRWMIFSTFAWCLCLLHSVNFVAKKLISWTNTLKRQCDTTKFTTISWLFLFLLPFSFFRAFFFYATGLFRRSSSSHCLKFSKNEIRIAISIAKQNAMFVCFYDIECPMDGRENEHVNQPI